MKIRCLKLYSCNTLIKKNQQLKNAKVSIFNIEGKLMYENELTNNYLTLPSIASGIYFVSVKFNHKVLRGKLIVK